MGNFLDSFIQTARKGKYAKSFESSYIACTRGVLRGNLHEYKSLVYLWQSLVMFILLYIGP